jgi:hypothetical protein
MSTALIIITALSYGYVLGRLHERIEAAQFGARCDVSALGWWIRKPEFRELYDLDQDGIEPTDFKPLQGEAMRAHFGVRAGRREFKMPTHNYERWRVPKVRTR